MRYAARKDKGRYKVMSNMTRHEIREAAFLLSFERMFQTDLTLEQTVEMAEDCELFTVNDTVLEYVNGVEQHREEIDALISRYLIKWTLSRISKVSLAILHLAVYEILYCDNVSNDVAISEAVLLVSAYGYTEDIKFVNGLLGNLNRGLNNSEQA